MNDLIELSPLKWNQLFAKGFIAHHNKFLSCQIIHEQYIKIISDLLFFLSRTHTVSEVDLELTIYLRVA